jgi:hypothetical protein
MNDDHPTHPKMRTCENCHDGQKAFDARGTQCARCHQGAARSGVMPQSNKTDRFLHSEHVKRGIKLEPCTQCHSAGNSWKASMPGHNDHKPCQNEGCHAVEFGKIGSNLCLNCHERNEPLAPNPLRQPHATRQQSEWQSGAFPHEPHLAAQAQCTLCHGDRFANTKPKEGHALCGDCHKPGTKLTMSGCGSCHVPLATVQPTETRPFSTRERFKHDAQHRAKCEQCHRAGSEPDVSPPTMAGCGDCHDGKKAFKVTGFGCARCHGHSKK